MKFIRTSQPADRHGFTIIEALVVLSIFITLMSIGYVSVVGIERRAPIFSTVNTVIADMRSQQTNAMIGNAGAGPQSVNYGIYFETNSYTLFQGASYNPSDPSNAVTMLPTYITFTSIDFPSATVLFTKGSGDVLGYAPAGNSVTVTQTLTGEHKTITINRYGAVTEIQ